MSSNPSSVGEISTMTRKQLKEYITAQGYTPEGTDMKSLREMAEKAFKNPKKDDKPKDEEKDNKDDKKTKSSKPHPGGALIKQSSAQRLDRDDPLRPITFTQNDLPMGMALVENGRKVYSLRQKNSAYWKGVKTSMSVHRVNGVLASAGTVGELIKNAVASGKDFTIVFDTLGREDDPISTTDPDKKGGPDAQGMPLQLPSPKGEAREWQKPEKEIDEFATAGGAGPRPSVRNPTGPAPGIAAKIVAACSPAQQTDDEPKPADKAE